MADWFLPPDELPVNCQAGRCEQALGKKEEAINYYKKALGLDKNLTAARDALEKLKG